MQPTFLSWVTLAGSIATAIATIFLWRVTKVLAVETKRMADASGRPQVVVSLLPSHWSSIHFDMEVTNTGNATAFDIATNFDPPLADRGLRKGKLPPYRKISVLNPGQSLRSYALEVDETFFDAIFQIECSWCAAPKSKNREILSYEIAMAQFLGAGRLNGGDPPVRIAQQLERIAHEMKGLKEAAEYVGRKKSGG
jgi:hypothetical protein